MVIRFDGAHYRVIERKTGLMVIWFATAAEALAYVRRES
jgi:hypothetical protein